MSPQEAGLDALKRIVRFHNNDMNQLRYIGMTYYILREDGAFAGVALWSGPAQRHSKFAVHDGKRRLEDCVALLQGESIGWIAHRPSAGVTRGLSWAMSQTFKITQLSYDLRPSGGDSELTHSETQSSPILGAVIDVQDFDGFSLHCIDDNVRERCNRQFSCAAAVAGSAPVGCGFKGTNTLVDRSHGRLGKVRVVLFKIILDGL